MTTAYDGTKTEKKTLVMKKLKRVEVADPRKAKKPADLKSDVIKPSDVTAKPEKSLPKPIVVPQPSPVVKPSDVLLPETKRVPPNVKVEVTDPRKK
jgi:hypothetical protein